MVDDLIVDQEVLEDIKQIVYSQLIKLKNVIYISYHNHIILYSIHIIVDLLELLFLNFNFCKSVFKSMMIISLLVN